MKLCPAQTQPVKGDIQKIIVGVGMPMRCRMSHQHDHLSTSYTAANLFQTIFALG